MRKTAVIALATMLLNVEKFAWVSLSIVRVWAVLTFRARIGKEKFAYFLDNKILYLCNIRNEAMAECALRTLGTGAFVVKLTPFFFICRRYHFLGFFLVYL